jgi:signal peptidase I
MKVLAAGLTFIAPGAGSFLVGRFRQGIALNVVVQLVPVLLALEAREPRRGLIGTGVALGSLIVLGLWLVLRPESKPESQSRLRWLAVPFALLVHPLLFAANLWFLAPIAPFQVPSDSMSPTLKTGDFFWIERLRWPARSIERGDVIVFDETLYNTDFHVVKRVVALGGDEVDACGDVHVNGERLDEPYVHYQSESAFVKRGEHCRMKVPAGHVYVLGDFRGYSLDSRSHGAVPMSNVRGRALYIFESRNPARVGRQIL